MGRLVKVHIAGYAPRVSDSRDLGWKTCIFNKSPIMLGLLVWEASTLKTIALKYTYPRRPPAGHTRNSSAFSVFREPLVAEIGLSGSSHPGGPSESLREL